MKIISSDSFSYNSGGYCSSCFGYDGHLVLARLCEPVRQTPDKINDILLDVATCRTPYNADDMMNFVQCGKACLVLYEMKSGKQTLLADDMLGYDQYEVFGSDVYYVSKKRLTKIDMKTGARKILLDYPEEKYTKIFPHASADGKYISLQTMSLDYNDRESVFFIYNTESGECIKVGQKAFIWINFFSRNFALNPKNPQQFLFEHGGPSTYITNRFWLFDYEKREMHNLVKQAWTEDNELGEYLGHAVWAPDGEGIYFVKYKSSPVGSGGIYYFGTASKERRLISSEYAYVHVNVNDKGLIADTEPENGRSKIVFINARDGSTEILAEAELDENILIHPHPCLSPAGDSFCYTEIGKHGQSRVIFEKCEI